jgi:hypothetical protein
MADTHPGRRHKVVLGSMMWVDVTQSPYLVQACTVCARETLVPWVAEVTPESQKCPKCRKSK